MRLDAVQRKLVKIDNFSKTLHLKKYYKKILKLMYNNRLNVIMQKYKTGTVSTKDLNAVQSDSVPLEGMFVTQDLELLLNDAQVT